MVCSWRIFHNWTKWEVMDRGSVVSSFDKVVAKIIIQERKCTNCGLLEIKKDRIWTT